MRDRPWRRPGAFTYARERLRHFVRPPVRIVPAPPDLLKHRGVEVKLRDGTTLSVNIYFPPGVGPFPVLLSAHPYGKDKLPQLCGNSWRLSPQFRLTHQSQPYAISSETSWEAPDPVTWTGFGYVVVNADLRGAGTSGGIGNLLSDAEALDVYDLIEWAGVQCWSTGAVGMLGVSYLALSQYKAAALHPPSLRAICPWEGFTDAYRDFMYRGGLEENGFARLWTFTTKRSARLAVDLGQERKKHPLHDNWWDALSPDLTAIKVPMLVCGSFSDGELHSMGSFRAFERAASEHRHLYTHRSPKWWAFYSEEAITAQRAFFDCHLKGEDTASLPRVRLEVRETGKDIVAVRSEDEWPLARTDWRPIHLGPCGRLIDGPPAPGRGSMVITPNGPGAAFELVMQDDLELTGPMSAKLWVSVDRSNDGALFVTVEKRRAGRWVPFQGSYGYGRDQVAAGIQRIALRELDEDASKPGRPIHTFTRLQPISPEQIVDVDVSLTPSSTLFRQGDALRVIVTAREPYPRNPLFGHFPTRHLRPGHGRISVHYSPTHPSHLLAPVIS